MIKPELLIFLNSRNNLRRIFIKRPKSRINNYRLQYNILRFKKKLLKHNIINNKKIAA